MDVRRTWPGRRILLPAGLLLLLTALALLGAAEAGTSVPAGTLAGGATWTFTGSPYTLDGKITVPDGATLRIEPGVEVRAPGGASIEVYGSLVVVGAPSSRVELRPAPLATLWGGIKVLGSGAARIENATIEDAGTGLYIRTSGVVTVSDTEILGSNGDGISVSGDTGGVWLQDVRIFRAGTSLRAENGRANIVADRLNLSRAFDCVAVRSASELTIRSSHISLCQHDGVFAQLASNITVESTDFSEWSMAAVAAQSSSRVSVGYSTFNASEPSFAVWLGGTRDSIVKFNTITMKSWPETHIFRQVPVAVQVSNPSGPNQLRGNVISVFSRGIFVSGAGSAQWLDGNDVREGPSTGIQLHDSPNQTITGNTVAGRPVAFTVTSSLVSAGAYYRQRLTANTADGRPIEWRMDLAGVTLDARALAILAIVDSSNVTVENASFSDGDPSLLIERSRDILVRFSTVTSASVGVGVVDSQRVALENLTVSGGLTCINFTRGADNRARDIQTTSCYNAVLTEGTEQNLLVERLNVTGRGRVAFFQGTNLTLRDSTITGTFEVGVTNRKRLYIVPPPPPSPPADPDANVEKAGTPEDIFLVRVRLAGVFIGVAARDFAGLWLSEVTVTQAKEGLFADGVDGLTIENSSLGGGSYGLHVIDSTNIKVANSSFAGATFVGADCEGCTNVTFLGNTFTANTVGLALPNGTGGLVTRNLFFFNQEHAQTGTALHQWDDGAVGNLWDDYTGLDADLNGIGDTPYPISQGADEDRYPIARYPDSEPPVANAGQDLEAFEDAPVLLTGYLSTDNIGIRSYLWSLNDGGVNVTVAGVFTLYWFATPGLYTVTLTVIDYGGNRATDTLRVLIRDRTAPEARGGGDRVVDEDVAVRLDGGASTDNDPGFPGGAQFTWYIFNGTATEAVAGGVASFTFATPGLYTVTMVVVDAAGFSDEDSFKVTVRDTTPPTLPPLQVPVATEDAPFRVYGSAPTDNDPDWPKGMSTWFELKRGGVQIAWTNASPGVFNVSDPGPLEAVFFVSDGAGNVAWVSVNFSAVDITPPDLSLFGDRQCEAGLPVDFDVSMADDNDPAFPVGAIANWTFFVPSGRANLEGVSVSFTFPLIGGFQAVLRLRDGAGNLAEKSFTVHCGDSEPPTITVEGPMTVEAGAVATFTANASDASGVSETVWEVTGLAGVRRGAVLAYRFFTPGSYQVTASVEDFYGQRANASLTVVVVDTTPPSILLELIPVAHGGVVEVTVFQALQGAYRGTDNSGASEVGWAWGDSSTSEGPTAAHNWSEPGNYTVMVRVADAYGNVNTTTFTVRVVALPEGPAPPPPTGNGSNPVPTLSGLSGLAVAVMVAAGVAGGAAMGFRLGRGKHKPGEKHP